MKAGWEVKPLGDFTEVVTKGTTPTSVGFKFTDTGVNFVKIEAIDLDGKIKPEKLAKISPEAHDALARSQLREGDVLFSIAGALGRITIVEGSILPANTNQALSIIRLAKDAPIDRAFLAYCLSSSAMTEQIAQQQGGVAQQNLSLAQVKSFQIPIPPLEEQKRIVVVLDAAFEGLTRAKENAEANLQNARELFEAALVSVFSEFEADANQKRLKEVAIDFGRGKSKHRPRNAPLLYDGPYPFIQTGDVRNATHLITEYRQTYSEKGLAQSKLWPTDTLCITIAANIAETAVLSFDACFPDSIIGVVPDPVQTSSRYLEYLLQFFQKRLKARGEGAAQHNINLATFETELFPFPRLTAQDEIIEKLDGASAAVQALEAEYTTKLADIADLRQSLLQKAFAGKLT